MAIAHGRFAGDNGMVVDIRKYEYSPMTVFNCQYWSDFTDENERFYIGSIHYFFSKPFIIYPPEKIIIHSFAVFPYLPK